MRAFRVVSAGLALAMLLAVLIACGGDGVTPTVTPGAPPAADPTATAAMAKATATTNSAADEPRGELTIVSFYLPASLDPLSEAYSLIQHDIAETLTRITPDQRVEPWLAELVEQTGDTTWRIHLRAGATFWDGSPVTAGVVQASIERSLADNPTASRFLPVDIELIVVDELTLDVQLPEPMADLPNNLAAFQFAITKPAGDEHVMTGSYRPVRLDIDSELLLAAYPQHWAGPPAVASIRLRKANDPNARILALQSGEVDIATEVPPELVADLGAGVETVVIPSTRMQHVILNHQRLPFSDAAVREAFSLAIDRNVLNMVAAGGLGAVTTSIFPPDLGIVTHQTVPTDYPGAEQILEEAGWLMGSDGVRVKDGERLSLTLNSYPGRPELTLMAVSIQDQLRVLGFEIEVLQVESIVPHLETGEFDASMFSVNMLPIGDPRYAFNISVVVGATYNYGGYENPELDEIIADLRSMTDAIERDRLILRAQEILAEDTVNVYLIAAPRIAAYRTERIEPFELHPNDLYGLNRSVVLAQ